jgi:hypothetical protein
MIRSLASVFALLSFVVSADALAQAMPETVSVAFEKIYVPLGFDSNDNIQMVGEGVFENSCYRPAPTAVTVDVEKKTVHLEPKAYHYGGLCLQVLLPFNRQIDVGILGAGLWTVTQGASNVKVGEINVAVALTKNADDFIYAPVSQAFFNQANGKNEVVMSLELPCDGLPVENVKVSVQKDVLVLQPIMKNDGRSGCARAFLPVQKTVDVGAVPPGRYLLHVRSMNGTAINSLFQAN